MKTIYATAVSILLSSVLAGNALAANLLVNIDFQGPFDNMGSSGPLSYTGLGAAPDTVTNTFWNAWRFDVPLTSFLASDGVTVSTLTVTTSTTIGYGNIGMGAVRVRCSRTGPSSCRPG